MKAKDFRISCNTFALERLIMGINAHARSEYALEYAVAIYESERQAFGKTINKFQALRHKYRRCYMQTWKCVVRSIIILVAIQIK